MDESPRNPQPGLLWRGMAEMARGQREGGNMHRTTDKQLIRHTSPQKRKTLPPQISHRDRMPAHEKPTEGAAKQEMNASPRAVAAPENQQSTAHTRSADHSQRPSLQHTLTDQQLVMCKWERSRAMALGRKARREENGGVPT